VRYLEVSATPTGYSARLAETEIPAPATGEVLVRVAASGLNRADLSQIAGKYPPPPGESEILGLEVSGTVEKTGENVCALLAGGGHAEYACVPAGQLFPAPQRVDLASAAGIPEAFLTAFLNLVIEGGLARGGRALIHAGASGVGLAAIQVAKSLGAEVAATTRSAAKLPALEKAGAALAIDSSAARFEAAIENRWGKDAIAVVLDPVGASTLAGDLAVLATGGRVISLATMSGSKAELDLALLMRKRARLIGSTLRSRSRTEKTDIVRRFREEILPNFDSGALSVSIDSIYPPERAAEAFTRMRENKNAGKILIEWSSGARPMRAEPAQPERPESY
jgi:putative PIG3 family NAD(P)H quinone oxidoreductase